MAAQQNPPPAADPFHLLLQNHPIPMWIYDLESLAFLAVNDAAAQKYGYTRDEFLALTLTDICAPEDMARRIAEAGECRHRRQDGRSLEVEISAHTLEFEGHKAALVTAHDISQRKQAEELLRKNEQILRLFVEHAPAAIAMFDREMRYIAASLRYLSDYELGDQDVVGRSHYEVFPEISERWKEIHRRCLAGATERHEEDPFPRASGKLDWIRWEIRSWYEANGEIGGIILFSEVITERKRGEEKLRESEERLRSVIENSPDTLYSIDLSIWKANFLNRDEFCGYSKQELESPGSILTTVHPDDLAGVRETWSRVVAGLSKESIEYRLRAKNGSFVWLEQRVTVINLKADGTPNELLVTLSEISERKRAEEDIDYQANLLANINDAILASDEKFVLTAWNRAAERIYGWRAEEVIGKSGTDILQTEFLTISRPEAIKQLIESGEYSAEVSQPRKDGTKIYIETHTTALHDSNGKTLGYVSINRDITERKRVEEELRLSEERFSNAFRVSPAGLIITRIADGKIVEVNKSFLRMFEFSREEVIGHTSTELKMLTPQQRSEIIKVQMETGGVRDFEIEAQAKSGRILALLSSSQPMEIGGEPHHITHLIDITERKRAEKSLRLSEERYRLLTEQIPAIVYLEEMTGEVGRMLYMSPQGQKILGIAPEQSADPNFNLWASHTHKDDRPRVRAEYQRCFLNHEPFDSEYRMIAADGRLLWIHDQATPIPSDREGALLIHGVLHDITERKQTAEKLLASEVRYRRLFEAAKDGILILHADTGEILDVNPFLIEMLGYSDSELLGQQLWEIGLFKDIVANKDAFLKLQQEHYIRYENLPLEAKNGHTIWVEFVSNVYTVNGSRVIQCNIRDITERKRAEDERALLDRVRTLVANDLDLPTILRTAVEAIAQTFGYTQVSLYLLEGETLILQHQVGYTRVIREIPITRGVAGRVARSGQPVLLQDAASDPTFLAASAEIVSEVCVPLFNEGKVIGILNIESTQTIPLSARDLTLTIALGEQISPAIARARLYTQLRESEERFSKAFYQSPIGIVLTDMTDTTIRDVNASLLEMIGLTRAQIVGQNVLQLNIEVGPSGRAAIARELQERGLYRNHEVRIRRSNGAVRDLLSSGALVTIGGKPHNLSLLQDITERKRAEDQLQKRFSEINAIYQSAQQLHKLLPSAALSAVIIHTLEEILGYEYGAVLLIDKDTKQLVPFAISAQGRGADFIEQDRQHILSRSVQISHGITGWVAEHGQSLRLGNVRQDARYYAMRENIQSELCVPLGIGDQVIGVINVESVRPDAYTENDQRVLETVAAQIAVAIQNARLLEETRLNRDRLAELSRQLVETHEQESRAIGRELHDQIGQMLTALQLTLEIVPHLPPPLAAQKIAQARELVSELMGRVSALSLTLRPPMLDDLGLIPALLWRVNRYQEESGIAVEFKHSGVEGNRYESEVETTAYRIIQEALTNVARHAQATRVRVALHAGDGQMEIQIEDNGRGFDPEVALTQNRGLSGIRERAGLLGGSFRVESQKGKGTRKWIQLPLAGNAGSAAIPGGTRAARDGGAPDGGVPGGEKIR